jgi:hypothetical protein
MASINDVRVAVNLDVADEGYAVGIPEGVDRAAADDVAVACPCGWSGLGKDAILGGNRLLTCPTCSKVVTQEEAEQPPPP